MILVRDNALYNQEFFDKIASFSNNDIITSCFNKILHNKNLINEPLFFSKYNLIKVFDSKDTIIYNTLYNSVVILNEKESLEFITLNERSFNSALDFALLKLGMLQFDLDFEPTLLRIYRKYLIKNSSVTPSVTILPTQLCNARCRYCFAEHNSKITMDEKTISEVVSFFKNKFKEGDKVLLRWFGGEPLVAEKIIDQIVLELKKFFNDKLDFESIMFTNGSLLTDQIVFKAKQVWNLKKVQLTIDGYKDEHLFRKNYSINKIDYYSKVINDIGVLLNNDIAVDCRINLDKDNFNQLDNILSDISIYNNNSNFRARVTILRPSDCGKNNFNYIYPNDLETYYRVIYEKLIEHDFITDVLSILPHLSMELCIAKSFDKIIIGSDGKLYNCVQQVFNDKYCFGSAKNGLNDLLYQQEIYEFEFPSGCSECAFLPICFGGCDYYRKLQEECNVTPCVREKFFIDMILEMVYNVYTCE